MVAVIVLWVTVLALPATNHRNGIQRLDRHIQRLPKPAHADRITADLHALRPQHLDSVLSGHSVLTAFQRLLRLLTGQEDGFAKI